MDLVELTRHTLALYLFHPMHYAQGALRRFYLEQQIDLASHQRQSALLVRSRQCKIETLSLGYSLPFRARSMCAGTAAILVNFGAHQQRRGHRIHSDQGAKGGK